MNTESPTYDLVEPLVTTSEQNGARLACEFTCPRTGKKAKATVDIVKANDSIATKAKSQLRSSAVKSATRGIGRSLRGILGNNMFGRLANDLVKDQGKAIEKSGGFDDSEMQCATLAAFAQVRAQFVWDEEHRGFVHSSAAG